MAYECFVRTQEAQPTLTIRRTTSVDALPQAMGEAYGAIMGYLAQLGATPAGPPFTAYHNMDMEALDVEIGFAVSRVLAGEGQIGPGETPGGKVATCLHVGPYHEVGKAYEALTAWMAENGYAPTGMAYEFYLNDPGEVPEDELETQVVFPVA
jgi:effector-binding domain-containing protein